jgi:hypothetical protein
MGSAASLHCTYRWRSTLIDPAGAKEYDDDASAKDGRGPTLDCFLKRKGSTLPKNKTEENDPRRFDISCKYILLQQLIKVIELTLVAVNLQLLEQNL